MQWDGAHGFAAVCGLPACIGVAAGRPYHGFPITGRRTPAPPAHLRRGCQPPMLLRAAGHAAFCIPGHCTMFFVVPTALHNSHASRIRTETAESAHLIRCQPTRLLLFVPSLTISTPFLPWNHVYGTALWPGSRLAPQCCTRAGVIQLFSRGRLLRYRECVAKRTSSTAGKANGG